MAKGRIRKLFPGGNTSQGFYSYYDNIIKPDATRIFIIKGGPGVGKSTLMRSIGETICNRGYNVEFHCCSSDNSSLDGICIPEIKVALIDGTAPHVVDPKNPGAVDEIVHLGDFWNEDILRKNKDAILAANQTVSSMFRMAYSNLRVAKIIQDGWKSCVAEAMNFAGVNEVTAGLCTEIFTGASRFPPVDGPRRLFATAITPDGPVNYLDTVLQDIKRLYVIKGPPGSGKATLTGRIADRAQTLGLFTELYHCSFLPQKVDIVIIPGLSTAVANLTEPVSFDPKCLPDLEFCMEIDLKEFLNRDKVAGYNGDIADYCEGFAGAFQKAVNFLHRAKTAHDLLESYYIPAMDFMAVNARKEEILARVLKYASINGLSPTQFSLDNS